MVGQLEGAAAVARSRILGLEGALRVKEREADRLVRLNEAAKVGVNMGLWVCVRVHIAVAEHQAQPS